MCKGTSLFIIHDFEDYHANAQTRNQDIVTNFNRHLHKVALQHISSPRYQDIKQGKKFMNLLKNLKQKLF